MFAELETADQVELYAYALANNLGGVQAHPDWYNSNGVLLDVPRLHLKNLAFEDMKKPATPADLKLALKYVVINISTDLVKQAAGKRTIASNYTEATFSDAGLQTGLPSAVLASAVNMLVHPVNKNVAPVTPEQAMQAITTQGVQVALAPLAVKAQPVFVAASATEVVPPKLSSEDITTFAPATPTLVYAGIPAPTLTATLAPIPNYLLWGGAALLLVLLLRR